MIASIKTALSGAVFLAALNLPCALGGWKTGAFLLPLSASFTRVLSAMPQRPSNREIKVLTHLGEDNALGPDDFKDVGEKVCAGLLAKGWVIPAEQPGKYRATIKGLTIHEGEIIFAGRLRS